MGESKKASIYTSIYGRKGILIDKKASCISVRKPLFFRNEKDIIPSLTVGKIKMATNPVNMGSVAVFYFVTICAIL